MLVVHPSSQCDVCLDAYTWVSPTKTPHAIQCGHVFCYECLRTVHPSNCPMCRKGFNPDRIKKLHVDRPPLEGSPRNTEETDFLRRAGALFADAAQQHEVNALVEEVTAWLLRNSESEHQPLRHAITALHQYKALQAQQIMDSERFEETLATHERHSHVKQNDLDIAMLVEKNMLDEQERLRAECDAKVAQMQAELNTLQAENMRMQTELDRYTTSPNTLPRPPEIIPLVASLTREHGLRSSQVGVSSLGRGPAPALNTVGAPTTQTRSSSGSSSGSSGSARSRGASVHFVGDSVPHESSRTRSTADPAEARPDKPRRHLIIPGAVPSHKFIPPGHEGDEGTPRAPAAAFPNASASPWTPRSEDEVVWIGPSDVPREVLPNEVPLAEVRAAPARDMYATNPPPTIPQAPPSVFPAPAPSTSTYPRPAHDTGSIRRVSPANVPLTGRSPMAWRPGHAHKEGYVPAYLPHIGIAWIPLEQANKLPVRARGTVSQNPYAIAKEPSEVDDEWRAARDGASPPSGPLLLQDVPVAGPSASTIVRGQYDASITNSALFSNAPIASDRTVMQSSAPAPVDTHSRPIARRNSSRSSQVQGPLGLELSSLPEPRESPPAPPSGNVGPLLSPATSWGTGPISPTRNSSLASLGLQGLPDPASMPRPIDSSDQLPIGEQFGGPIVVLHDRTPRHTAPSSLYGGDNMSISGRSDSSRSEGLGLGFSGSAGSSGVISGLHDLEEVNRSLQELAAAQARQERDDAENRSSRPSRSRRHSRQVSFTGVDDADSPIVRRIGIPIYSSVPSGVQTGRYSSNDPSPPDPSPPVADRPRSRSSHRSSYSTESHRSSESTRHRPRRGSVAALNTFPAEPQASSSSWIPAPLDPFSASVQGMYRSSASSQKSLDSIPRAFGALEIPNFPNAVPGSMSSLLLNFGPENNTSAVTATGEEAAGIHAPRPVAGRRSSFFGNSWSARSSR